MKVFFFFEESCLSSDSGFGELIYALFQRNRLSEFSGRTVSYVGRIVVVDDVGN